MITPITKPLNTSEIDRLIDQDGCITVVVSISLSDLIDCDIDALNDLVEDLILSEESNTLLSGIGYTIIGHDSNSNSALIEVTATVEDIDFTDGY